MDEAENILQKIITDTEKAGDGVGEIAAVLRGLAAAVKDIRDAIGEAELGNPAKRLLSRGDCRLK